MYEFILFQVIKNFFRAWLLSPRFVKYLITMRSWLIFYLIRSNSLRLRFKKTTPSTAMRMKLFRKHISHGSVTVSLFVIIYVCSCRRYASVVLKQVRSIYLRNYCYFQWRWQIRSNSNEIPFHYEYDVMVVILERTRTNSWRSENFLFFEPLLAIGRNRGVSITSSADWLTTPSLFYIGLVARTSSSILIIATTWHERKQFIKTFKLSISSTILDRTVKSFTKFPNDYFINSTANEIYIYTHMCRIYIHDDITNQLYV